MNRKFVSRFDSHQRRLENQFLPTSTVFIKKETCELVRNRCYGHFVFYLLTIGASFVTKQSISNLCKMHCNFSKVMPIFSQENLRIVQKTPTSFIDLNRQTESNFLNDRRHCLKTQMLWCLNFLLVDIIFLQLGSKMQAC